MKCKCGKILKPGYSRCWRCDLTAERSAPEVAEESSVTAADRATTETDVVWADKSRNIFVHSRNMERQRDEARWKRMAFKAERDTALAKLAKCRKALQLIANEGAGNKVWGETKPAKIARETLDATL